MDLIKINLHQDHQFTLVPNWFLDHYLSDANGDFVKVYLLLLRLVSDQTLAFSTAHIADQLHLTESDVVRALKFWTSKDLLKLEFKNKTITAISFNTPNVDEKEEPIEVAATSEPVVTDTPKPVPEAKIPIPIMEKPQYGMDDITRLMSESAYKDLIYVTGRYLGKSLSQTDLTILISLHDWLNLPFEVIEWLIEYCASNDHRNMRYIEKVAIEWADRGITTLEKAKTFTENFSKKYYLIKKALGFANRSPVPYEIKVMDKWIDDYQLDMTIILEACDRTMKQAPNGSFSYADKILTEWYKNKVRTLKDIEQLDQIHSSKAASTKQATPPAQKPKNKFVNYNQRDYDFEDLEKKAFERLLKENSEGEYIS